MRIFLLKNRSERCSLRYGSDKLHSSYPVQGYVVNADIFIRLTKISGKKKNEEYCHTEEGAPLWQQRMGDPSCRSGFSSEMHGLRTSDHGGTQACGEKYTRFEKIRKKLNLCFTSRERYARINNRDIFHILAL